MTKSGKHNLVKISNIERLTAVHLFSCDPFKSFFGWGLGFCTCWPTSFSYIVMHLMSHYDPIFESVKSMYLPSTDSFVPATNKLEVVNRISNLTNAGRQALGPGSKEKKSVVMNLAAGLDIPFSTAQTKQEIASNIARVLGATWTDECQSVGQTLTLIGLNILLESAESYISLVGSESRVNPGGNAFETELRELAPVVKRYSPRLMDGETCVNEMKNLEHSQWRQTEWHGFYFEMKVCNALVSRLGGGPEKILNTPFDYVRNHVWDLKVHSNNKRTDGKNTGCQLNDRESFREAAKVSGVGLMVLSGQSIRDSEFAVWHRRFRGSPPKEGGRSLVRRFESESLDFYFFKDEDEIRRAEKSNILKNFAQGRQADGSLRNPKFLLNTTLAIDSEYHRHRYEF